MKKKYLRNFVKACTVYAVFKPVVAMLETPLKLCQCDYLYKNVNT